MFPLVAGLSKNTASFPEWWGTMDVAVAVILAILAIALLGLVGGNVSKQVEEVSYRAYRFLLHGILVVCIVYQLAGDGIVWPNCLPGFAWRTWLLLYCLPAWITAFRDERTEWEVTHGTEARPANQE